MITGYNTDIEHDGVVYHVQTEDKGTETPIILSLVYSGGAILASKRSPYDDLIDAGFDEAILAERLKRQHRLICAAIHAGRVDDLKQMSSRGTSPLPPVEALVDDEETISQTAPLSEIPTPEPELTPAPSGAATGPLSPYTVYDSRRNSVDVEATADAGLRINLLDEAQEFYGGENVTFRAVITRVVGNQEKPLSGAAVSVKVLGTTFRPMIQNQKTGRDGDIAVSLQIPSFSSGRAAILVRVVSGDKSAELRRVIHPSK